jgi:hypothetical protein
MNYSYLRLKNTNLKLYKLYFWIAKLNYLDAALANNFFSSF